MLRKEWMKKIIDTLKDKGVCTTGHFMELVEFYGGENTQAARRKFYRALNDLKFLGIVEQIGAGSYRLAGIENRLLEVIRETIKQELGSKTK